MAAPLCLVMMWAPAVAEASGGALSQLPGSAACVSDYSDVVSLEPCKPASGLKLVQSVAVSPDGSSLYAAAVQSDAITAFSRDPTTGLLTQVAGSAGCIQDPSAAPETGCAAGRALQIPDWVVVNPDGKTVYSASFTSQAIDVFSRDGTTGGLTQLAGSAGCLSSSASETSCTAAQGLDGGPGGLQTTRDGKYAYVAVFGNGLSNQGAVAAFSIGSTGALTQLSGTSGCITDSTSIVTGCATSADSVLRGAASLAISPDGKYVYVAANGSQAVTVYARASDGSLTRVAGTAGCVEETNTFSCAQGVHADGLEGPMSVTMSPDGSHVYVSSFTNKQGSPGDTVAVFSRDSTTGALTELSGKQGCFSGGGADPACTAVPVLGGDFAVTTSPDGSNVYVTAYQSNAVVVFSADSSGALTLLPGLSQCVSADGSAGQCAAGTALQQPHQVIFSPDGSFAYVAGHQNSAIDIFATVSPASSAPSNTVLPAISGGSTPGTALQANLGSWSGTQTGYSYQWRDCDRSGANCTPIAGTTGYTLNPLGGSSTYTTSASDLGHTIRLIVKATNSAGSTTVASSPTAVIASPPTGNPGGSGKPGSGSPPKTNPGKSPSTQTPSPGPKLILCRRKHHRGPLTCAPAGAGATSSGSVGTVSIGRRGKVYATGRCATARECTNVGRLVLIELRTLRSGRYTLTIRLRHGRTQMTRRIEVSVILERASIRR